MRFKRFLLMGQLQSANDVFLLLNRHTELVILFERVANLLQLGLPHLKLLQLPLVLFMNVEILLH